MITEQRIAAVRKAYESFKLVLNPSLLAKFCEPDTATLCKKPTRNLEIIQIKLLPKVRERAPKSFWSTAWCFYQIAHGHGADNLELGSVFFCHFANNARCCSGHYAKPVEAILKQTRAKRPKAWLTITPETTDEEFLGLKRAYRIGPYKEFPAEEAGRDLAWMIEETLPQFLNLDSL